VTSEILELDLEDSCKERIASEIIDLLYFYKVGVGRPQDIVAKMRSVIESCCTFPCSGSIESDDSLSSIVEKFRKTGEQYPACALLDELDNILDYSPDQFTGDDPAGGVANALAGIDLTAFVGRTLKIVNAIPSLP
jgi:hypothetical protein